MANQKSYQALRTELDNIVGSLQDSQLDIDQAAKAYERGMTIIKELEAYLKTAENKIIKLTKSFEK